MSSNQEGIASSDTTPKESGSVEEPSKCPQDGLDRTRKRFLDSLRHITSALSDDTDSLDDFAIKLAQRFRKQSRTTAIPKRSQSKTKLSPKTSVYKRRLTCLADPKTTSIRNLHRILPQLNSSGLGEYKLINTVHMITRSYHT